MSHLNLVDTVETGNDWSKEATICAVFHNFLLMRGTVDSPTLQCHGHDWRIQIFKHAGGKNFNAHLVNKGRINVKVHFSASTHPQTNRVCDVIDDVIDLSPNGKVVTLRNQKFETLRDSSKPLKVYMTIRIEKKSSIWTPPKRNWANEMLQKLESGKDADVVFQVNGTLFPAHKEIIMQGSHAFCEILSEDSATVPQEGTGVPNQQGKEDSIKTQAAVIPIDIDGVDQSHFQLLLRFLYTDETPFDLPNMDLEAILIVANRFGCIRLKLLVEAEIVKHKVNVNNAIVMLVFAEAQSCALLKEKALDVFSTNPNAVMASAGWTIVEGSNEHLRELMSVLASKTQKPKYSSDSLEHMMSVATLREELHGKGLDVDGTREMLVTRLIEANHSTSESETHGQIKRPRVELD